MYINVFFYPNTCSTKYSFFFLELLVVSLKYAHKCLFKFPQKWLWCHFQESKRCWSCVTSSCQPKWLTICSSIFIQSCMYILNTISIWTDTLSMHTVTKFLTLPKIWNPFINFYDWNQNPWTLILCIFFSTRMLHVEIKAEVYQLHKHWSMVLCTLCFTYLIKRTVQPKLIIWSKGKFVTDGKNASIHNAVL